VTTFYQVAGVGHLVLLVDLVAEEGLHTIPEPPLDDRGMGAGIPLASELDVTDVGTVYAHG